jgi:hypothetical protein
MWTQYLLPAVLCLLLPESLVQGFLPKRIRHPANHVIHPRAAKNGTYDLWVSHYSGKVYTLNYNPKGKHGKPSLKIKQELETCGGKPSWLTWDHGPGILYCVDETYHDLRGHPANGSLTMYYSDSNSILTEKVKVPTYPGGVSSVTYSAESQEEFLAIAHLYVFLNLRQLPPLNSHDVGD